MRNLKLQVQMTVDGYIAGPKGEMDFFTWNWGDDIKKYVGDLVRPIQTVVLGRKVAEGFIPHWEGVAKDPKHEEYGAGRKFTDCEKVVFSKTLVKSPWERTVIAKGDLAQEINTLKRKGDGDLFAYGGSQFVGSLIESDLVDDYYVFINPVVAGKGMPIFDRLKATRQLEVVETKPFSCGIVMVHYRVVRA
ncbi:MAG TPA: dihydrofolate reductase family protein [Gemmatimonadaceae bacterium]|nr:dihydrofolate reductase family protein [Gemmatimonadaceae bacterium]